MLLERRGVVTRTRAADIAAARRAVRQAAESGSYDAIIAAGGDGTIRHAAAALIGTDMPLGIIPVGTGNVLAHEIGLARTAAPSPACCWRARRQGRLRPGQRRAVPADGRRRLRCPRGGGAGPAPEEPARQGGLRRTAAGRHHPPRGHAGVTVDGHRRRDLGRDRQRTPLRRAVRAGAAHRHPGARAAGDPVQDAQPGRAVRPAHEPGNGRLEPRAVHGGDVEMLACSRVTVASHHPVPIQIDGDTFGTTPVEVDAGTCEVRLIVPSPASGGANPRR